MYSNYTYVADLVRLPPQAHGPMADIRSLVTATNQLQHQLQDAVRHLQHQGGRLSVITKLILSSLTGMPFTNEMKALKCLTQPRWCCNGSG